MYKPIYMYLKTSSQVNFKIALFILETKTKLLISNFISNGISNGHDTTFNEEGSVQSVVANPYAAGGAVAGAAVGGDAAGKVDVEEKDDAGTKDGESKFLVLQKLTNR